VVDYFDLTPSKITDRIFTWYQTLKESKK
jgi:hypothetical protein